MISLQEIGDPKQKKPPDRVNEKFAQPDCPSLTMGNELYPPYFHHRFLRIAADQVELGFGDSRVFFRLAIQDQPEHEPDEPQCASYEECPSPAEMNTDPGHAQRGKNGASVRACVEDARRQRSFFFREPFGDGLDAGWEDTGLTETQR